MKKDVKAYSRDEIERLIDQWIIFRRNAERDRQILKRALLDGVSQEKLAEEYGLSVRRTQDIIYQTQEILFRHL